MGRLEQTKGMIAERESLNIAEAFSMLRNHARNHNLLLADVSRDVISGALAASALDRLPAGKPSRGGSGTAGAAAS